MLTAYHRILHLFVSLQVLFWLLDGIQSTALKFYVYEWPDVTNHYSKFKNDLDPSFVHNYGAGNSLNPVSAALSNHGYYNTWQFALFKLMYERLLTDQRRTLDAAEATTFVLPYDFGLDACFRPDNGKMRKINCPLAHIATQRLLASPHFNHSHGHNHLLIVSVNQNMNYFLGASNCQSFLSNICYNCTKVSIDEYSWLHSINRFEAALNKRGDFWHAIPFPANIHAHLPPSSPPPHALSSASTTDLELYPWQRNYLSMFGLRKTVLVSYTGSLSSYNAVSRNIRKSIGYNCAEYANATISDHNNNANGEPLLLRVCETNKYHPPTSSTTAQTQAQATVTTQLKHDHVGAAPPRSLPHPLPLACYSVFCFQPPGDMPTRKSVFDSILCGCIPVFFHNLTGPLMYEWHWDMDTWFGASIMIDQSMSKKIHNNFVENPTLSSVERGVDLVGMLMELYKHNKTLIERKQVVIEQFAERLQYSIQRPAPPSAAQTQRQHPSPQADTSIGAFLKSFLPQKQQQQSQLPLVQQQQSQQQEQQQQQQKPQPQQQEAVKPLIDAFEITIRNVLEIHAHKRTHARRSHYMRCEDKFSYYVDWCWSTGSLVDVWNRTSELI